MNRIISVIAILVSGCIGTMDAITKISGIAPIGERCEVFVYDSKSNLMLGTVIVSGAFNETVVLGGASSGVFKIVSECEGVKGKSILVKGLPKDLNESIELGNIKP